GAGISLALSVAPSRPMNRPASPTEIMMAKPHSANRILVFIVGGTIERGGPRVKGSLSSTDRLRHRIGGEGPVSGFVFNFEVRRVYAPVLVRLAGHDRVENAGG